MRVTFGRVVRSECTKLLSLRSSWLVLGGMPVLLTGVSALIGFNSREHPTTPTAAVSGGFLIYALTVGIFGLLAMTGEYQSGLIRVTLWSVPRRLPVLWAKALVLAAVIAPVMVVAYLGSLLAHQSFAVPAARVTLGDPHVLRAIFGAAGATVAAGLIGLGIGAILRSTAGAIAAYVAGVVLLPPTLLSALPASWQGVLPYMPTLALQAMFQVGESEPMLNPGPGALVAAGWVMVILGGASVAVRRWDA